MPLQPGTRLGPYEVHSLIGTGGMGEVYRARDTRLDRTVALKVLAPELANDAEFRARFAREAKAISALNHAHICGLYDIGREHDIDYLVLELLEGETLAARLARGALPFAQVLRHGIEIADALEAAHTRGIVHRDLKPGNVMLTAAGTKLLDFGLAKHTVGAPAQALSMLATAPGTGTAQGTIIGTLQYMAPEQVQGAPADARTDIFALGSILYEMATGRRAFEATTQASLIAKILETEPPALSSLAPLAPAALDHVVQGCLAKAPADRWQTAHDVKMHLQWIQAQGSRVQAVSATSSPKRRAAWWLWGVAAAAAGALASGALLALFARPLPPARPMRFDVTFTPGAGRGGSMAEVNFGYGTISPDGQRFVFHAFAGGNTRLMVKNMASSAPAVLPGTEGGVRPFWSRDGQWVGFFHRDGHLKKLFLQSGEIRVLAKVRFNPLGDVGTWVDDVILFATDDGRLFTVAADGGTPRPVNLIPNERHFFTFPRFLPDGRHFLLTVDNDPGLYVASLDGPSVKKLVDQGASPAFGGGHLLYSRGSAIFARPFDPERLEFLGAEVQVTDQGLGASVSDDGTIAFESLFGQSMLTWFDRAGRRSGTLGEAGTYQQVVLSPHGRHATVVRTVARDDVQADNSDLWDVDLTTGVFSRLTTWEGFDGDPSWSPDERTLAFSSMRDGGRYTPFVKDLVTGKEEPLVTFGQGLVVDQWTPDGRFIIARTLGRAVYAVDVAGDRTPRLLVDTPYTEDEVHVSPDGRCVAFNSDESGRWEVYLASFPAFTSKRQISSAGGVQPQWRGDGRELFYLASDGWLMSVRVDTRMTLAVTAPVRLFQTPIDTNPNVPQYAVTADGQRFLGLERTSAAASFTFLVNWLNAKSPTGVAE